MGLSISNPGVVDYGIEGTELISFSRNGFRPGDRRKVSGDGPFGAARGLKGIAAPSRVSAMQHNAMSLLDQQLGGE